jgi:hypothetical protein
LARKTACSGAILDGVEGRIALPPPATRRPAAGTTPKLRGWRHIDVQGVFMADPILWYFADPMCSWCWGFAPVIEQVREAFHERTKIALVLGGLRPGTTEPMSPQAREDILHHWRQVHELSGQDFRFDGA